MRRFRLIVTLFLLSGGTALLYQVAFGKKLATIFGATAYAVSAVLAAFMGGLALGSHFGGRWGKGIKRPLAAYGFAEVVVGLVCAITPWLFDGVAAGYQRLVQGDTSLVWSTAVRMSLTALVVIAPTIAMGATLPLLSRTVAGQHRHGDSARQQLAMLYAINTGGGAIGALLSAYWILPTLGVYTTMRAAALVNLFIGMVALWVSRRDPAGQSTALPHDVATNADEQPSPAEPVPAEPAPAQTRNPAAAAATTSRGAPTYALTLLAFASGLLVFCAEVVDTHLLALLIGNSAYAFGLMLAAFLTCLSAGAVLAGRLERRFDSRALPLGLLLAAAALLLTLPMWGKLPLVFLATGYRVSSWLGREWVRAVVALMALAVPTAAMGLTFPLLLRAVAAKADVAAQVGRLTAVNTVGAIVGSILCGYLLLPALGSQWTLRLIGLCFAVCAVFAAYVAVAPQWRPGWPAGVVIMGAALAAALLLPRWDMLLMTNGANVYFDSQPRPDELVFVREDVHSGLTSVARRGHVLTMYTNGKFQGDNGHEVTAQRSFAHFPSMFVKNYRSVLVIGLGTGTTLGTIAAYPYQRITVAEISPAIVEAADRYFRGPNLNSMHDSRVKITMNDGRNVLLVSHDPYDLITIELTSVWFAGAANLYSAEFYQLCFDRLTEAGVLQQWVQLHHIRRRDLAVVLRTLRQVFPHVALFVSGGQGIVVAGKQPLIASRARLEALTARPRIRVTLGEVDGLATLMGRLLLSGAELDAFIKDSEAEGGAQVSTDDNLYLEYETPKGNVMSYDKSYNKMVGILRSYRADEPAAAHLRP